jgi:serine/threonine-protein kinase HipA
MNFKDVAAYVVRRFDRIYHIKDRDIRRIHQEDFCQGMGVSSKKYQKEGGPSIKKCFYFIKNHQFDKKIFFQILLLKIVVFNFIIGNSDAHGKNFSFLHTDGGLVLSPLYDLVSTQAYDFLSVDMAMSIGGEYNPNNIDRNNFVNLAKELQIALALMLRHLDDVVCQVKNKSPVLLGEFRRNN